MKRLSIFLVGLLSAVLVFSVFGLADTEGSADATLTLTDVIDITIPSVTLETSITQNTDLDSWNNASVEKKEFGTFTVNILTLTNYTTSIGYSVNLDNAAPSSLNNDPLYVDSDTNHSGSISDLNIVNNNSSLDSDFGLTNNVATAGEIQKYDLLVNPADLTESFDSGDSIEFTVTVTVSDSDV